MNAQPLQVKAVTIGGRTFNVAPIVARNIRRDNVLASFKLVRSISTDRDDVLPSQEQLEAMIHVVALAAVNAGEVTREEFEEAVDDAPFLEATKEIVLAFAEVMRLSHVLKAKTAEPGDLSPGEAESPQTSTSESSTG